MSTLKRHYFKLDIALYLVDGYELKQIEARYLHFVKGILFSIRKKVSLRSYLSIISNRNFCFIASHLCENEGVA